MAKQAIVIYHLDLFKDFIFGCRILASIKMNLTPLYGEYKSVLQSCLDQPTCAKTPSKRIGYLTKNTEAY